MATQIYNSFKKENLDGSVNLMSDTIKGMLCTTSYTPNVDTHTKRSDVTNEVSATGYTAGGITLTNKKTVVNLSSDLAYFDADDLLWGNVTITARWVVLYKSTGNASTDNLIAAFDMGSVSSSLGDFQVVWGSQGLLSLV